MSVLPSNIHAASPHADVFRRVTAPVILYPRSLAAFLLLATLDLVVTGHVLAVGGSEVNPVAAAVLACSGIAGMALLKAASVSVVAAVAQLVGRTQRGVGLAVMLVAAVTTAYPVVLGTVLLRDLLRSQGL
ncbi:MAG: DUF5658 family protein [Planctomycetota bacterium]